MVAVSFVTRTQQENSGTINLKAIPARCAENV